VATGSAEKRRPVLRHLHLCPKTRVRVIPLMLHGDAGSGIGSRLKGRAKMGGSKIPQRHMRYVPLCKTPEHNSSRTCPMCFQPIRLMRARRIVNGKSKLVRVNGAVQCVNPDCISFKQGYADRGRDTNAAVNIALSGYVQLTSDDRKPPPPFDPLMTKWFLPISFSN
jgi:hypothetical protein